MSQQSTIDKGAPGSRSATSAYPASWVDRFFEWVRRLPVPAWLFYLGLWLLLGFLISLVAWVEGSEAVGVVPLVAMDGAMYIVYYLALMHYLDGVASRSLDSFQPLLQNSKANFARLRYELTTLPTHSTVLAVGIGILATLISLPFTPSTLEMADIIRRTSTQLSFLAGNAILAIFIYHTIRQLRIVTRIHNSATRVNLFHREPMYAFSRLTARTGVGWILGLTMGLVPRLGPLFTSERLALLWVPFLPLAALVFILPLASVHALVVREKGRLQGEVNQRLERVISRLHKQMDNDDFANIDELKTLLDSLLVEQEAVARIPTWPWKPGTLAGFTSALLVPVAIWFFQQLLAPMIWGR